MAYTVDPLDPSTPIDSEGMGYGAEEFRLLKQRINDLETILQDNIDLKLAISANLSDVGNASTSFDNIKQNATETYAGVVEEATSAEMTAGTGGKFPDCATVKTWVEGVFQQTATLSGASGSFTGGSCKVVRIGDSVVISGNITHSSGTSINSATGYLPTWARPASEYFLNAYNVALGLNVDVAPNGRLHFNYSASRTSSLAFTISYTV